MCQEALPEFQSNIAMVQHAGDFRLGVLRILALYPNVYYIWEGLGLLTNQARLVDLTTYYWNI